MVAFTGCDVYRGKGGCSCLSSEDVMKCFNFRSQASRNEPCVFLGVCPVYGWWAMSSGKMSAMQIVTWFMGVKSLSTAVVVVMVKVSQGRLHFITRMGNTALSARYIFVCLAM